MADIRYFILVVSILFFTSCKQEEGRTGPISIVKLHLPDYECDPPDSNWSECTEAYAVANFNINDTAGFDTINKHVFQHYSKSHAKLYKHYHIDVYQYDPYGKKGYNERMDLNDEEIYNHPEWIMLLYRWSDGKFEGIAYYSKDKMVKLSDSTGNVIQYWLSCAPVDSLGNDSAALRD